MKNGYFYLEISAAHMLGAMLPMHTPLYLHTRSTSYQWCSGKFALVGTLAWHYDHIPYGYLRGGGVFLNESSFSRVKIDVQTLWYINLT